MSLFAVADLHLPGGQEKPMQVFGAQWEDHFRHITESWQAQVTPADTVLISGDISWAMRMEEALPDLEAIGGLPGRKVLIRGNHDYWWGGISRLREMLPEGMFALQQDAMDLGEALFPRRKPLWRKQTGRSISGSWAGWSWRSRRRGESPPDVPSWS